MAKQRVDKIKRFDNKADKTVFELVSKGGMVAEEVILQHISKTRLANLDHDRYFEKVPTDNGGRYRLAVRGRHLAEDRWGITNHTNTKVSSTVHDCRVGDEVGKVKDISSVITEDTMWERFYQHVADLKEEAAELEKLRLDKSIPYEQRQEYAERWKQKDIEYSRLEELKERDAISAPDFGYIDENGALVFVEITTGSYGFAERQSKQEMAKALGGSLRFVKA